MPYHTGIATKYSRSVKICPVILSWIKLFPFGNNFYIHLRWSGLPDQLRTDFLYLPEQTFVPERLFPLACGDQFRLHLPKLAPGRFATPLAQQSLFLRRFQCPLAFSSVPQDEHQFCVPLLSVLHTGQA